MQSQDIKPDDDPMDKQGGQGSIDTDDDEKQGKSKRSVHLVLDRRLPTGAGVPYFELR